MEEIGIHPGGGGGGRVGGRVGDGWKGWTAASVVQFGTGIYSYRKVRAGECRLMPLKAFGIASLFVGAGATSFVAVLTGNGIHSVKDVIEVGANIRSSLGGPAKGTR